MSGEHDLYNIFFGEPDSPSVPLAETTQASTVDTEDRKVVYYAAFSANELYELDFLPSQSQTDYGQPSKEQQTKPKPTPALLASMAVKKMVEVVQPSKEHEAVAHTDETVERFYEALNQNTEVEYPEDDVFGLAKRIISDVYWPDSAEISSQLNLDALIDSVFAAMASARQNHFTVSNILGIVKAQGVYLYTNDLHEFLALLASHPNVAPRENGNYFVSSSSVLDASHKQEKPSLHRPINPSNVGKVMKEIDKTPEMYRAKDLAKNKADNRKRGRHRKSRGGVMKSRMQGKKKTFEQLLAESLKNNPLQ